MATAPLSPPAPEQALEIAQAHLGAAITAYGHLGSHASRDLHRSRAWARIERARLLDELGRPAEAARLRARAELDLTPAAAAAA